MIVIAYITVNTMPNGNNLLHGILGIFGISGTWTSADTGVTTHVANIIAVMLIIFSLMRINAHWYGYKERFKNISGKIYYIPHIAIAMAILLSNVVLSPSSIDQLYFHTMARREGIAAVSICDRPDIFVTQTDEGIYRYNYNFTLYNHSSGYVRLYMRFYYTMIQDGERATGSRYILNESGQKDSFTYHLTQPGLFIINTIIQAGLYCLVTR